MTPRWTFTTAAWGWHLDHWLDHALPAVLDDLAAFDPPPRYLVYVEDGVGSLSFNAQFLALCTVAEVEVAPLSDRREPIERWMEAQRRAMDEAKGGWLVSLLPDVVYGQGSIRALLDHPNGTRAICASALSIRSPWTRGMAVRPTNKWLAFQSMTYPQARQSVRTIGNTQFTRHLTSLYWHVPGGLLSKTCNPFPLAIQSTGAVDVSHMDVGLLDAMNIGTDQIHMLTEGWNHVGAEVTQADKPPPTRLMMVNGKTVEQRRAQVEQFTLGFAEAGGPPRCTPLAWELFCNYTFRHPFGDAAIDTILADELGAAVAKVVTR